MKTYLSRQWPWIAGAWLGALTLIWLPTSPLWRMCGMLLLGMVLPGWLAFSAFFKGEIVPWPEAVLLTGGLGYAAFLLIGWALHILPGPISRWGVVVAFSFFLAVLGGLGWAWRGFSPKIIGVPKGALRGLIFLLIIAAAFRLPNLGYAEFQGDEVNVVHLAAAAIQGREDAFFYHKKGPAEILTVLTPYAGARSLTEGAARLPFALASLLFVLGLYVVAHRVGGQRAAFWAGLLGALNGFFVAFGRIVQYQSLVLLLSALTLYCALVYADRREVRDLWLCALFAGVGLLAHTDAIFADLAAGAVIFSTLRHEKSLWRQIVQRLVGPFLLMGALLAAFYLPYFRHPFFQVARTYISGRKGLIPADNLGHLVAIGSVYNAVYYLAFLGVGLVGVVGEALLRFRRWGIVLLAIAGGFLLSAWVGPQRWQVAGRSYAVLAYVPALLPLAWVPSRTLAWRAAFAWFVVPFFTYLFFFADPRTHLYVAFPGACLLVGVGLAELEGRLRRLQWAWYALSGGILALSAAYLALLFVNHHPEYKRTYPQHRVPIFWAPYGEKMPSQGLFGFPYCAGWKVIGVLYAQGILQGDYGTNEEAHITHWYTRGAPISLSRPRYYFLAENVQDVQPVPLEEIARDYTLVGRVWVGGAPKMAIYERHPASLGYRDYRLEEYASTFDRRFSGLDYEPLFWEARPPKQPISQ